MGAGKRDTIVPSIRTWLRGRLKAAMPTKNKHHENPQLAQGLLSPLKGKPLFSSCQTRHALVFVVVAVVVVVVVAVFVVVVVVVVVVDVVVVVAILTQ